MHNASPKTILLVEDEDLLRDSMMQFLEILGHHVISASNAEHALKVAEDGADISLLVADFSLGGEMSGAALAQDLLARQVVKAAILMSGESRAGSEAVGMEFLQKPFSLKKLQEKIAELTS